MNQLAYQLNQTEPSQFTRHEVPEKRFKLLIILLVIVLIAELFWIGFLTKENNNLKTELSKNTPIVSPSQENTKVKSNNISSDWKLFPATSFQFYYPPDWLTNVARYNRYIITDAQTLNSITFEYGPMKGRSSVKDPTFENVIQNILEYELASTAFLGTFGPVIEKKENKQIDGQESMEFTIRLTNPKGDFAVPPFNYTEIQWIFIKHNDNLLSILLEGKDQQIFNQVVQSVKFTGSQSTENNTK